MRNLERTMSPVRLLSALALGALVAGAGCAPAEEAPTVDCTTVTVPTYSQLTIWPLCTTCHSSALTGAARKKAPTTINLDSFAGAQFVAYKSAAEVHSGSMPEASQPQPTEEQKTALYTWAACGAPN